MHETSLKEIADGSFAYLQTGSWGFSNAGLVTSEGASLLVDTLYDMHLTRAMLHRLRQVSAAAHCIDTVVNTHANGDHCWGNDALPDARLLSSRNAATEMRELSPRLMHTLVLAARAIVRGGAFASIPLTLLRRIGIARAGALLDAAPFIADAFGAFDFGEVSLRVPSETFEGRLVLRVGDKDVHLIEVGPAHTRGDVIVYVPADRLVFTGDILFIGSHPVIWEGPIDNWVRACDTLLSLDVDVVVPGHGPLTDKRGVRETRDYWTSLAQAVARGVAASASAEDIAREVLKHHAFTEAERIVVNVDTALRELRKEHGQRDPLALLAAMARFARIASAP
jgi:glyoxylase-like metal-dependent hydrolase (beta-lactamase superfamily II)